jgi:hypothetical protein
MEPDRPVEALSHRLWAAAVVLLAAALFVLGGGFRMLRGPERLDPEQVAVPVAREPSGELGTPPTRFVWTPGHPDALAQVVLHRADYRPIWSSEPVRGVSELEVPLDVWKGKAAGRTYVWRVREVLGGKPISSSAHLEFTFRRDWAGYGPGEGPPELYADP